MASTHSRSASDEVNISSMSYILEHVLQYPGSYDVPLRTMHELNRKAQSLSRAQTPPGKPGNASPVTGQFAWNGAEAATMSFTSQLMKQLRSLPTRPSSLPPTFIVNFVSRCFHPSVGLVDWNQALTALDYLNDLDSRRRRETSAAFARLHIQEDTYDTDMAFMAEKFPGIALWVRNIEGKNKKADQYYAIMWLGLRRWIMINVLSDDPFNKLDCLSLLNTLLPPMYDPTKLPPLLNQQSVKEERRRFFDLISRVQKTGPAVLQTVIDENKGPGDVTGWTSLQTVVDKYLRVARNIIDDCLKTTGPETFDRYTNENNKEKKHDSGVSFGSERRPSMGPNVLEKQVPEPLSTFTPAPKGLSKLERITREFKRMRVKPRPEVEEITQVNQRATTEFFPQPGEQVGKKKLKKARSLASLKFNNGSSLSLASRKGSDVVPFDADQMKKQRMMYEASVSKNGHGHVHV
ncbi:Nn.00g108920.m01.CDS01 [Neocucurbitaria sp. VM-36]